jgi:hypothetical protein
VQQITKKSTMIEINHNNLPEAVSELFNELSSIKNLLLNQNNQPETDQLLTIQQTGEFIKLTPATIYGLVSKNSIPYSKKGKRLYFSKQELINWIKEGRQKTITEISNEANTFVKIKGGSK